MRAKIQVLIEIERDVEKFTPKELAESFGRTYMKTFMRDLERGDTNKIMSADINVEMLTPVTGNSHYNGEEWT